MRIDFLEEHGFEIEKIKEHSLQFNDLRNKIESFIGSVEIPIGLLGPLTFNENGQQEFIYSGAATLEGALVASINRGAKAISLSGGFEAEVLSQEMVRAPMFVFEKVSEAQQFVNWCSENFAIIKKNAEKHSNHAVLKRIQLITIDTAVHLRFIYSTGDASGQNMTTTCTWNAVLWLVQKYHEDTQYLITNYVIEGNASSDKKVSDFVFQGGRGTSVKAQCFLSEEVINRILRTSSDQLLLFLNESYKVAKKQGMIGYNINIANVIAAIFTATGQDIASVHESSLGKLSASKVQGGLNFSLELPSLVIGSIGGGTGLPKQKEVLELMGCYGSGKVERFAKCIAGFALSLEISTFSAVVSGEFAKSHEKLGRNKPLDLLLKSEINKNFINTLLNGSSEKEELVSVKIDDESLLENGILTTLTSRTSKKLIGFIPLKLEFQNGIGTYNKNTLLKIKGRDTDVINGLHLMASSIDAELADLIFKYRKNLEYKGSHTKELMIYEALHESGLDLTPHFYGKMINTPREIYLLLMEALDENELTIFNAENRPEEWTSDHIKSVIEAIHQIHQFLNECYETQRIKSIPVFNPKNAIPFYQKLSDIVQKEESYFTENVDFDLIQDFINNLQEPVQSLGLPLSVIHNDFNPRNVAIRTSGSPVIYDWELSIRSLQHRDVIEFLSFVLPDNFDRSLLLEYLEYHFEICQTELSWDQWKKGYIRSLKEYVITRVLFYKAANILMKLKFSDRIFHNAMRMYSFLTEED